MNQIHSAFIYRLKDRWEGYDHYYLFVTWIYEGGGSEVRVGRSENVTGPFLDEWGVDMAEGGGTRVFGQPNYRGPYSDVGRPGVFEYNYTHDVGLPVNEMGVQMNNTGYVFTFGFTDRRYEWQSQDFLQREFRNQSLFGAWYLDWRITPSTQVGGES